MKTLFEHKAFQRYDFNNEFIHEYSDCTFKNCNFFKVVFDSTRFEDCKFISCDLSMVKFGNTVLQNIEFSQCKLMGIDFSKCSKSLFSVSFDESILDYAVFVKNNLKNAVLKNCRLLGTSFIEVNLTAAAFVRCDMAKAVFDRSNLERADFTTSWSYSINPEANKLKKTKFSLPEIVGLLNNLDIVIE
jgi:uncharacterized protein YjbI with pentapeptide repeats